MSEQWKNIKGFEGRYKISTKGRVKSATGIIRKTNIDKKGYPRVDLKLNGKRKNVRVHRLVGTHFFRQSKKYPFYNHIDNDKQNPTVKNLEQVNNRENVIHGNMVRAHKRKTKRGKIITVKRHIRK